MTGSLLILDRVGSKGCSRRSEFNLVLRRSGSIAISRLTFHSSTTNHPRRLWRARQYTCRARTTSYALIRLSQLALETQNSRTLLLMIPPGFQVATFLGRNSPRGAKVGRRLQ